jgi:hypothetical protein
MVFFAPFFSQYVEKTPQKVPGSDEELQLLTSSDGVGELDCPPIGAVVFCPPPKTPDDYQSVQYQDKKYLWVLLSNSFPYILEYCVAMKKTKRGKASHTNLTGGANAWCSGELWFGDDTKTIYLNGGSGRYPPKTVEELNTVAEALKGAGYTVVNFGWDEDRNGPARYYRG